MSAPALKLAEPIAAPEPSKISCRDTAAQALAVVRDGVITGEGPTTKGRVHFSRALDAFDAAWCARILTATAVDASGQSTAISTQVQAPVDSVDLSQTPPLLSINGQNYTMDQLQKIVAAAH